MYTPVDPKADFPKQEEEVLKYWKDNGIFKKSVSQREGAEEYVFYDGPPFATGLPHFGHFIPSTIKDIIPRYQTMKGKKVERRFGWDCHGLPVENLIEKELGINSKHEIEAYGVANFNDKCRASVLKYTSEWRQTITRMGRWVDFDNDYKTMNPDYMESIWWVAKSLWDKGMIYEGKYILPYCPRCSTVLSTHELAQGYKEKQDPAITIRFKITKAPDSFSDHRINGRNSSTFKDFGVLFTECRSNMNATSTVFGRNIVRVEHTERAFLALLGSLLSAVCRIRKRRKIREKRLVPCAHKFTALFLVNDSIRFLIFIIGRKTRFCQNVVVAGIVVRNFYIVNIRSHTKTFI